MEQEHEIERLIQQHGLGRVREKLVRRLKPSFELRLATPNASGSAVRSRLGGLPDLVSPNEWPIMGRKALTFIGHIDLSEVSQQGITTPLPDRGLLSFFYDTDGWPSADTIEGQLGWRVLYHEEIDNLIQVTAPTAKIVHKILPQFEISYLPTITVPCFRSIELDEVKLANDEFNRYGEFRDAVLTGMSPNDPLHRLLGHPDGIQGCMQRTVQFVSRNEKLPKGIYSYYEHPRAAELIHGSFDWQLLLQVDSDQRLGVMWGDAGRIYYWMHKDDIAARNFSNAWVFLQCY